MNADVCTDLSQVFREPEADVACVHAEIRALSSAELDTPGPWLRSWIEFQVDAGINRAFRQLAVDKLEGVPRTETETGTLRSLTTLQATVANIQASMEELHQEMSNQRGRLGALAQSSAEAVLGDVLARQDSALRDVLSLREELRQQRADLRAEIRAEYGQCREEVAARQRQHSEELDEVRRSFAGTRRDLGALQTSVTSLKGQLGDAELEKRLLVELEKRLAASRHEMSRGLEEHCARQKKAASELRMEVRAALRNEATAVAQLDEQLWLTDQRLGQRIDKVMHSCALYERCNVSSPPLTARRKLGRSLPEAPLEVPTPRDSARLRGPGSSNDLRAGSSSDFRRDLVEAFGKFPGPDTMRREGSGSARQLEPELRREGSGSWQPELSGLRREVSMRRLDFGNCEDLRRDVGDTCASEFGGRGFKLPQRFANATL